MKKNPLANGDKYKIQQLLLKGKKPAEIAVELDRTTEQVETYIDGELADILELVAKVDPNQVEEDGSEETAERNKIVDKVKKRLIGNGLTQRDVNKIVKKALALMKDAGEEVEENRLYSRSIGQMRTSEFIIKKTMGGNDGIGIMTGTASQRSDMSKGRRKKPSSKTEGNIYQPSTGKFL